MAYQHQASRRYRRERQLLQTAWARRQLGHSLAVSNSIESRREAGKTLYVARPSVTPTPRTILSAISAGRNYVLRSWPAGYRMHCHFKGKQSSPRQDLYLNGSPSPFLPLLRCNHGSHVLLVTFRVDPRETLSFRSRVCASRNMAHDGSYVGPWKLRMQILYQGPSAGHLRKSWL